MQEAIRRSLLKIGYPVLKWAGKIGVPHQKINEHFFFSAQSILTPGMVLLTRREYELSNMLQDGFYKHAAIFSTPNSRRIPNVVEAIGPGVRPTGIIDFMFSKDYIKILKPKFADEYEMNQAAINANTLIGKPYDFQFKPTNNAWYCSEVIWWAYDNAVERSPFVPRVTLGVPTITPQDFDNAKDKWETVLDSRDFL